MPLSLAALLEVKLLESEVSLHDASGLDAGPQHILLGGDVVGLGYPFQVVQVAERGHGDNALIFLKLHKVQDLSEENKQ